MDFDMVKYVVERRIFENTTNDSILYDLFMQAIDSVDENLSYKDLAVVIANILKNEYGEHLYEKFLTELKNNLQQ
jgi:hypothetical protein